ncbi:MAG: recombinase family protein [Jiangellaceae bacterium]
MDVTEVHGTAVEQIVVYLRISEDRTGAEAGVERQRQDCLDLCQRMFGICDPVVFVDNDISAYSGKKRPGYLDLLERVRLGRHGSSPGMWIGCIDGPASWKT